MDIGASKHMTNTKDMLHNIEEIKENVRIGDGTALNATHKGMVSLNVDGTHRMQLKEVLVVPQLTKNLISETELQKHNKIEKYGDTVKCFPVRNENHRKPQFGSPLVIKNTNSENGAFELEVQGRMQQENMRATTVSNNKKREKVNISLAHQCLGHVSMSSLKEMARQHNW